MCKGHVTVGQVDVQSTMCTHGRGKLRWLDSLRWECGVLTCGTGVCYIIAYNVC